MYGEHQDTIQALTVGNSSGSQHFRQALATTATQAITQAVTVSTQAYQSSGPGGPTIGSTGQYSGGVTTSVYLSMAASEAANGSQSPSNEYVSLLNSMSGFGNAVDWVQKTYPGQQSAGTILAHIATAPHEVINPSDVVEVRDPRTGELVHSFKSWPIDREHFLDVYATTITASHPNTIDALVFTTITGTFGNTGTDVTLTLSSSFTTTTSGSLQAQVTSVDVGWSSITINVSESPGFANAPGLYDALANWIANTGFFKDFLLEEVNSHMNSSANLDKFTAALNAGLKKLAI